MLSAGLKFIHVATIAIWAAGLICLPFVYRQRSEVGVDHDLHRLHAMTRFFYVVILSPAAFVAIGSGTVLIFDQQTFVPWFTVKLFFVGVLVLVHVLTGLVILKLFEEAGHYPNWRYVAVTSFTAAVVTAILVVVSGKPEIDIRDFQTDFFQPGYLGEMLAPVLEPFIRLVRP
ncbi:CopD family protein [Pelagibacterium limicola]|uniref:CopD family protein n=1 Tax=Pelagibacterium limicola TaxID=2791022 RepID=UPI001FE33791|nr:CopD family protein [Pelagibacterium limicola]